jgi:hypothetical protein
MDERFDRAARANADRAFRNEVLHYLERMAIALENNGPILPYEAPLPPLDAEQGVRYNGDAITCTCGNDPKKACSACTSARMAWVHNMNPDWRPDS